MNVKNFRLKNIGILLLFLFAGIVLHAQEETTSEKSVLTEEETVVDNLVPFSSSFGAGVAGGIWAIPAVDFAAQLTPWLGLNLGYNRFDLKFKDKEVETADYGFTEKTMLLNGRFALQNVQLTAHLSAPRLAWLRLQLGAALSVKEDIYADFSFKESIFLNELEIKPENIGTITTRLEQSSAINPYIGLGLGRLVPKKRIGLSLTGGVFYRGEPDISVVGTNMLAGNEQNEEVLEQNFNDFKWLPSVSLRLSVRFK